MVVMVFSIKPARTIQSLVRPHWLNALGIRVNLLTACTQKQTFRDGRHSGADNRVHGTRALTDTQEKIMNKYSAPSLGHDTRELRDDELDAVTGGLVVNAIIVTLVGLLLPAVNPPKTS
jgi:hypothetical protein